VDDPDTNLAEQVCDRLRAEFAPMFDELHRFVDRRIAELSAEVHGTAQLLDFIETNLSGQLGRIHEQIASVAPLPASRRSGVEPGSVVRATEPAANQVSEAAEVVGGRVRRDHVGHDLVTEKINAFFEACTFQGIIGQRISRAIEHLQRVEAMLADMMPVVPGGPPGVAVPVAAAEEVTPDEVERLVI